IFHQELQVKFRSFKPYTDVVNRFFLLKLWELGACTMENKKRLRQLSKPRSTRGRIRTLNPQSRNLIFYPIELRSHSFFFYASSTACTFSAASFKVIAEVTFNPDSSMIL